MRKGVILVSRVMMLHKRRVLRTMSASVPSPIAHVNPLCVPWLAVFHPEQVKGEPFSSKDNN